MSVRIQLKKPIWACAGCGMYSSKVLVNSILKKIITIPLNDAHTKRYGDNNSIVLFLSLRKRADSYFLFIQISHRLENIPGILRVKDLLTNIRML
jgi:hypothetical protein